MRITDSPAFCVLPWVQLFLSPDGTASLCCQSPAPLHQDGRRLNAQTHALRAIWRSEGLKDARRRMAAGERLPQCEACWQRERFAGTSYRTYSNTHWLAGNDALRAAIDAAADWEWPSDPLYLDLRLGNICNLKCTICKPLYSSQIERDPVHAAWNTDAPYHRLAGRFADGEWSEAEALVEEIMDLSGNVAEIQIAGGEPTINRTQMGWLKRLCDQGRAGAIDLVVTTNLTNARPDFLDMLARFRTVRMVVSVDGHGATYEYVRFPAKWPVLVRNMAKLRAARPDADLYIACVLQALNPASLPALLAWALDEDIRIVLEIGRGLEAYNDVRILPPSYRAALRGRIEATLTRHGNREVAALRDNVRNVFAEIDAEDFSDANRRAAAIGLMQFVNDMDRSRRLSFAAAEPDLRAAIADYAGGWDERTRFAPSS